MAELLRQADTPGSDRGVTAGSLYGATDSASSSARAEGGGTERAHVAAWRASQEKLTAASLVTTPARMLVDRLVAFTGSPLLALLVLVVAVRVALFPLAAKAERDTRVQRSLAGRVARIDEAFEDDPRGRSRATLDLYAEYDIRPLVDGGDVVFDANGKPLPVISTETISDEVVAVDDGWEIRRTLPWHTDDEYTTTTCLLSEYEWADTSRTWPDLTEERAAASRFRVDLGYDMMPIIHVPNEEDSGNHFGRSVLLWSAQVLADLGQSDRDNVKAVSLAAHPIVRVSASNVEALNYRPGSVWPVDSADSVDMSSQLADIYAFNSGLRDRLGTVGGVNDVVLGKVNGDIAGITLKLLLGPFEQMISTLRVTRQTKYSLMMKIWQRLAMITGTVDPGPTVPLEIAFGPITPTDLAAVIEQVTKLLSAKSISRSTALRMLVAAGIPIDDVDAELHLIAATDFEGATNMSTALDDERPAADYLGIKLEDPPVATALELEL